MSSTKTDQGTTVAVDTAPAADIAPDGSAPAIRANLLGGLNIGWNTVFTTLPIYVGLIIIWLYFNYETQGVFIGARNLSEMAQEYSYESVLALGIVFVLLLGEIDLSLGYLTLVGVTITASFSQLHQWNALAAIAAGIVICTILGLIQGFLIAWVRMPAFVVTLGGFLIFQGVALHIVANDSIAVTDPFITSLGSYNLPNGLSWALAVAILALYVIATLISRQARTKAGLTNQALIRPVLTAVGLAIGFVVVLLTLNSYSGVPIALAMLAALTAMMWFFATRTRFGRHIYAVGGNIEAARRAGINTTAVRWIVFGIAGLFAGIASIMLLGHANTATTTSATPDLLLDIISISVIGGVSLTGGKGSVWAVLLGGLLIASLDSGLNLMSIDPNYVYVIKGSILLAAILIDVVGKRRGGLLALRR